MRAIRTDRYGDASVLEAVSLPDPVPGPGEVLVRVRAVSLNSWDAERLSGRPRVFRFAAQRRPSVRVLGADVAGTVERVGPGVANLDVGAAVVSDLSSSGWGGLAEFVVAPATAWTPIPDGVSFEQAAAVPQAGTLALQGLVHRARVRMGERVLVVGAGGGVGTFAVQLAKEAGASVTAADAASKLDALRALGSDDVLDRSVDWADGIRRWDVILDPVASRSVFAVRHALEAGGRYVVIGGRPGRLLQTAVVGPMLSRGGGSLGLLPLKTNDGVADLLERVAHGRLVPVIDSVFPLEDAADAFRRLMSGEHVGKVVVTVG